MRIWIFAAVACLGSQVQADEFYGPCAVFTETARIDRSYARYLDSVANDYDIEDGKFATVNQKRIGIESSYIQQFRAVKNFMPVFGTAWFVQVKSDGTPTLCRWAFATVPDRNGARVIAEGEVARRRELGLAESKVEKRGQGWIVRTGGTATASAPGQPVRSIMDLHIACKDTVVVQSWARPDIHSLPLKSLAAKARAARGKAWYWHLDPTIVPAGLRKEFVKQIRNRALSSLQRRDSEGSDAYYFRRLLGDNYLNVVSACLLEIEEVNAWLSLPTEKRGFRGMAEVRLADGGRLSKLARVLRQARGRLKASDDSVMSVGVRAGIPQEARDLVIAGLASQPELLNSAVGDMLITSVEQKTFESVVACRELPSSTLGLIAGVAVAGDDIAPSDLMRVVTDAVVRESHLIRRSSEPFSHSLGVGMADGLLAVTATTDADQHDEMIKTVAGTQSKKSSAIIDLRGDLSLLANQEADSETGRLLQQAERAVDNWLISSAAKRLVNVIDVSDGTFRSLADRISSEGDWTTKGSVRLTATSVRGELKVGRELARFLTARYIAARNRLHDSIVPGKFRSSWDLQMGR